MIIGIDEVGRGAFAGPLVAAAVCFPNGFSKEKLSEEVIIRDSKKMTASQRSASEKKIRESALFCNVGFVPSEYIDKYGITAANLFAFTLALEGIEQINQTGNINLLIDGKLSLKDGIFNKYKSAPIVKGDSKIFEISAASIVAKVARDIHMTQLSQMPIYANYLWHKNKGYGTAEHILAIKKFGVTKMHRKLFLRKVT